MPKVALPIGHKTSEKPSSLDPKKTSTKKKIPVKAKTSKKKSLANEKELLAAIMIEVVIKAQRN